MKKATSLVMSLMMIGSAQIFAAEDPVTFKNVTKDVVDKNPPMKGNAFDYVFMDINDDNLLDILVNNHNKFKGGKIDGRLKDEPVWLGNPDHTFTYWKNLPEENSSYSGFWMGELDHNGDGKTDIVWTGNEGGAVISMGQSERGSKDPVYKGYKIRHSSPFTAFADIDGDGSIETFLRPGHLYKDITKKPSNEFSFTNRFCLTDFNNDGWLELFNPGNQGKRGHSKAPRTFYKNNNGKLEVMDHDKTLLPNRMAGYFYAEDFNNDGNMDLYIFHEQDKRVDGSGVKPKTYPMQLFYGDGNLGFTDVTEKAGFAGATDKFGYSHVYLADIDNNGYIDILNQGNYGCHCWLNNGDGTFSKLPKRKYSWISGKHMRFDDYNMDGKLDIVTGGPGASFRDRETSITVFKNTTENGNKWLKIQLRQAGKNTMALGSAVRIYKAGTKELIGHRLMMSDTAGTHPRLHFGLAKTDKVDVEVSYPNGAKTVSYKGIAANRYIVLRPDGSVKDVVFGK